MTAVRATARLGRRHRRRRGVAGPGTPGPGGVESSRRRSRRASGGRRRRARTPPSPPRRARRRRSSRHGRTVGRGRMLRRARAGCGRHAGEGGVGQRRRVESGGHGTGTGSALVAGSATSAGTTIPRRFATHRSQSSRYVHAQLGGPARVEVGVDEQDRAGQQERQRGLDAWWSGTGRRPGGRTRPPPRCPWRPRRPREPS